MKPTLFLLLIIQSFVLTAQVWTYSYPESIVNSNGSNHSRSGFISVEVEQGGQSHSAYVMYDKNQEPSGNLALNSDNHWTNFSMKGSVTVRITRLDSYDITSCKIFPSKKGIQPIVDGKTASFTINDSQLPLQLYVELNNMGKNAIFIFADPEETDVPSKTDENVEVILTTDDITTVRSKLQNSKTYKYFEEGFHQWGTVTGTSYAGYKLPLVSGKKIYIPGGAYVVGTFSGSPSNNKMYGRGIISCAGKNMISGTSGIPFSIVQSEGDGKGQQYEGFVSLSPPHFHLTIRGEVDINNVKMLGWWHSTDGIVTGHNSTVTNCFFKVMDDAIKLYSDNCYHENNTMYHQVNGAPFQFSWGNQYSKNNVMKDTYIVNSTFKTLSGTSNTAVINARSGKAGNITENQLWDGIYIDNGCHRLIGLEPEGGTHRNYTIKNVELNNGDKSKPQQIWSYLQKGVFSNIRIENLTVNGSNISTTSTLNDNWNAGALWFQGSASALVFASCNDSVAPTQPQNFSLGEVTDNSVSVSWNSSTDNVAVTAYDVYVNGNIEKTTVETTVIIDNLRCDTEYQFMVKAKDACSNWSDPSDVLTVQTNACSAIAFPGKVYAAMYTNMSGIQTETTSDQGGGENIGFINAGDWTEYVIDVSNTATYKIEFRVATNNAGGIINVISNGNLKGSVNVTGTGGWQSWVTVSENFSFDKGEQVLRLGFDGGTGFLFNLNWFEASLFTNLITNMNENASLYPNPVENELNFVTNSKQFRIFDLNGKPINVGYSKNVNGFLIDMSETPGGIYYIQTEKGLTYKLVKF